MCLKWFGFSIPYDKLIQIDIDSDSDNNVIDDNEEIIEDIEKFIKNLSTKCFVTKRDCEIFKSWYMREFCNDDVEDECLKSLIDKGHETGYSGDSEGNIDSEESTIDSE